MQSPIKAGDSLKTKRFLFWEVPEGWRAREGNLDIYNEDVIRHSECGQYLRVGITDDGQPFLYCPRCLIVTKVIEE